MDHPDITDDRDLLPTAEALTVRGALNHVLRLAQVYSKDFERFFYLPSKGISPSRLKRRTPALLLLDRLTERRISEFADTHGGFEVQLALDNLAAILATAVYSYRYQPIDWDTPSQVIAAGHHGIDLFDRDELTAAAGYLQHTLTSFAAWEARGDSLEEDQHLLRLQVARRHVQLLTHQARLEEGAAATELIGRLIPRFSDVPHAIDCAEARKEGSFCWRHISRQCAENASTLLNSALELVEDDPRYRCQAMSILRSRAKARATWVALTFKTGSRHLAPVGDVINDLRFARELGEATTTRDHCLQELIHCACIQVQACAAIGYRDDAKRAWAFVESNPAREYLAYVEKTAPENSVLVARDFGELAYHLACRDFDRLRDRAGKIRQQLDGTLFRNKMFRAAIVCNAATSGETRLADLNLAILSYTAIELGRSASFRYASGTA